MRIKVLTGAAVTTAGLTEGCAARVAALRSRLPVHISVFADVHEGTSVGLGFADPVQDARQPRQVRRGGRRDLGPSIPVLIGGRMTGENIRSVRQGADGAIVATSIRSGTEFSGHIDLDKAERVAGAASICTKT